MKNIKNKIICGESSKILRQFPSEFIDCVVTSPPYWGLRDYGVDDQLGLEKTFDEYIIKLCNIFDEVKRVLKKTGTCWVNLGDTYNHSCVVKFKNRFSKQPFNKSTSFGRGGQLGYFDKCLTQIPFRFSIEMVNRGWILRNTIIWHKPNCMPSSAKDRFTVDFEYVFFFTKARKYCFERQLELALSKPAPRRSIKGKSNGKPIGGAYGRVCGTRKTGRNKRCVWRITTRPFKEAHFAVFPEALVETPIKAGCPENDIVLDPFCGSGTTLLVAKKLGRNYIGIDANPDYVKMSKKRVGSYSLPHKIKK